MIECGVYGMIIQSVFASDKRFSVKNEMPDFADILKFLIRYEDMLRRLQVKKTNDNSDLKNSTSTIGLVRLFIVPLKSAWNYSRMNLESFQ